MVQNCALVMDSAQTLLCEGYKNFPTFSPTTTYSFFKKKKKVILFGNRHSNRLSCNSLAIGKVFCEAVV